MLDSVELVQEPSEFADDIPKASPLADSPPLPSNLDDPVKAEDTASIQSSNLSKKCTHIASGVKSKKVIQLLNVTVPKNQGCLTCRKSVSGTENSLGLWACLSCGAINCGNYDQKHAQQHHELDKSHSVVINLETLECWFVLFKCLVKQSSSDRQMQVLSMRRLYRAFKEP
jgi:ribosomal protein L37AE/L43A